MGGANVVLNSLISALIATALIYIFARASTDPYRVFLRQHRWLAIFGIVFYVLFRTVLPYIRSGTVDMEGVVGGLVFGAATLGSGWLLARALVPPSPPRRGQPRRPDEG